MRFCAGLVLVGAAFAAFPSLPETIRAAPLGQALLKAPARLLLKEPGVVWFEGGSESPAIQDQAREHVQRFLTRK